LYRSHKSILRAAPLAFNLTGKVNSDNSHAGFDAAYRHCLEIRRLGGIHFCSSICRRLARTMPYPICTCSYGCASPNACLVATFSAVFVWPIIQSYLAKNDMSGYERAIHTPYRFLRMVWNGPKSISTAAPYFRKFLPRGAFLVGNLTFVKFAKAPQTTPQMVALKLLANLLELHRGQRTQSQMCSSAREYHSVPSELREACADSRRRSY
jgi:hypothetical protein